MKQLRLEKLYTFNKIIFFFLVAYFVFTQFGFAQEKEITEREIKLSGNYYWGEGKRDSVEEAKSDAIADLQFKISATIKSQSESRMSENDNNMSSFFSKNIKVFSNIKLKGLEFLTKKTRSGKFHVIAYLSKEKYKKTVDEIAENVRQKVSIAERVEIDKGIVNAIESYYSAYLMTYYSPDAISYESKTYRQKYSNIRFFLETKVKSFLSEIEIAQDSIWIEPGAEELINVNLKVTYLKLDVNDVVLRFDIPGNPNQKVEEGYAKLFLYSQPSNIKEKYKISLSLPTPQNSELTSLHEQYGISETQNIKLDFSSIVKVDFKAKKLEDGSLMFEAYTKNISVSSLNWEVDNGVSSEDLKFIYRFTDDVPHKVTLKINNSKFLTLSKFIDKNGKVKETIVYKEEVKKINPIINDLLQFKTYDTIIKEIIKSKNEGKLIFSLRRKDFINLNSCYGIVIDINTRKVVGFFTPGGNKRYDLLSKKEFTNYAKRYKGKGIIWFQLN